MKQLDVFDPPMCCSTGVCGEDVDSKLVRFAADIEWLKARGGIVRRFNLSQEPQMFMNEPEVLKAVSFEGTHCLPLLVQDGKIVSRATYPTRDQLAVLTGISQPFLVPIVGERAAQVGSADVVSASTSGDTPAKRSKTGCCSR